jgi:hypothetical protein
MKRILRLTACFSLLGAAGLSAQPVTVPALGPRYKQTRERVEILFGRRDGSYPLPDVRTPLFQTAADSPSAGNPAPKPDRDEPEQSDEFRLAEAVAVLKNSGTGGLVSSGGRTIFTYGRKPYKEGDPLGVVLRGGTVVLRITRITTTSVTLTLNGKEAVWRFSNVESR